MSDWIPATVIVAIFLAFYTFAYVVDRRNDRKYESESAQRAAEHEAWEFLTDEDREWFSDHGYSGPPDPSKMWSTGWL